MIRRIYQEWLDLFVEGRGGGIKPNQNQHPSCKKHPSSWYEGIITLKRFIVSQANAISCFGVTGFNTPCCLELACWRNGLVDRNDLIFPIFLPPKKYGLLELSCQAGQNKCFIWWGLGRVKGLDVKASTVQSVPFNSWKPDYKALKQLGNETKCLQFQPKTEYQRNS